jgi:hypothetical protein
MKNGSRQRRVAIRKVKIPMGGVSYDAIFVRHRRKDRYDRVKNYLIDTECVISTVDESRIGKDRYHTICSGIAKQSHLDRDNKMVGLKLSFARAIRGFAKGERTIFWESFKAAYLQPALTEQKV